MLRLSLTLLALIISLLHAPLTLSDSNTNRGKVLGAESHSMPSWFKDSFLEIADDVDEATEEGKQVILFFHLDACPYCDRMIDESFESPKLKNYIQSHFDTIAINIKGDREIAFNEELSVTEKELSQHLNVFATPAIIFLGKNNQIIQRVDGFRAAERFASILQFVKDEHYQNTSLGEYLDKSLAKGVYTLRNNQLFSDISNLSEPKESLLLIFEDSSCFDCNEFHERVLGRTDVQSELENFTIVRLDARSKETIIGVDGRSTTPFDLAKKYNLFYRPGVLAFDNGKLIHRNDSLIFHYHFRESLRFVSGGYYKSESYENYSNRRTEELLANGVDIDLSH